MFGPHYDELESVAHAELQETFGSDRWEFVPMVVRPNLPPQPDPTRKRMTVPAVFDWGAKQVRLGGEEVAVATRDPRLHLHVDTAPVIKIGDMFIHLKNGNGFQVTTVEPDGYSGVEVQLVQTGRPR